LKKIAQADTAWEKVSHHRAALIFVIALAIGASFLWRHVYGLHLLGNDYNPLVYNAKALRAVDSAEYYHNYDFKPDSLAWDETYAYARYTQQVLRGDLLGNTSRRANELLGIASGNPTLGPCLTGVLAYVVGDVRLAYIVADMLFPAILAVLLILFCLKLRSNLEFALFATALFVWFNWSDVLNLWNMIRHGQINTEVIFLRTPLPQVSEILFVAYLYIIYALLNKPTLRLTVLLAAIVILNFTVYVYSWTFMVCMLGSAIIMCHIAPEAGWRISLRKSLPVAAVLATGSLIALPIWGPLVWASGTLSDLTSAGRFGGEVSHLPDLKWTLILSFIIGPAFLPIMKDWRSKPFWILYWIAAILVINTNVLSGRRIEPHHWAVYYFQPFFMIYLADLLWHIIPRIKSPWMPKVKRNALLVFVVSVIVVGFAQEVVRLSVAAAAQAEYNRKDPCFEELVATLNNLDKHLVVLTLDPYLSKLLPAYVRQRFLLPGTTDPLTNREVTALRDHAAKVLGYNSWTEMNDKLSTSSSPEVEPSLKETVLQRKQVVFVKNRHDKRTSVNRFATRILLNEDFEAGFLP
jgi:hypothetical protein